MAIVDNVVRDAQYRPPPRQFEFDRPDSNPGTKPETSSPATGFKAPTTKPITTEVDAKTETVENRLTDLTASGSKYIEQARGDAQRSANTRGLINSSMAGASGVEAAIRSALPIAQQDATTFTDTRRANQDTQNRFLENRQSADLNIEAAARGSELNREEAVIGSELAKGEMVLGSALNQEESTLLNDLTMKRDQGLAELTAEENQQLADLEAKRDASLHQFDIERDRLSAGLNEDLARLESTLKQNEMVLDADLKLGLETALNDERFSDEMKLQMVSTMNNIIRDTQQQIVEVGLSDRTAAQQAAAIELIQDNRDAELAVYEDLLSSFNDWDWGLDFTPGRTTTPPPDRKPTRPGGGGGGGGGGRDDSNAEDNRDRANDRRGGSDRGGNQGGGPAGNAGPGTDPGGQRF